MSYSFCNDLPFMVSEFPYLKRDPSQACFNIKVPKMQAQSLQVRVMSRRATRQWKQAEKDGWLVVDVTSKSDHPKWVQFSPFFPLGNLRVPGQEGQLSVSESVEGAWQGLKVFEREGPDARKLRVKNMKGLKRPVSEKRGRVLGHKFGDQTISYVDARRQIYLPLYEQALQRLRPELQDLAAKARASHGGKLALLDYETNGDVENTAKPLSHASLVATALILMT